MWALLLVMSCAMRAQRVGMLDVTASDISLTDPSGRTFRIIETETAPGVRFLDGLEVEISGRRVGRRFYVRRWTVTDAGDGSLPFIGTLRFESGDWLLDDLSTGTRLILDHDDPGGLYPHVGKPILVSGFVNGPQVVQIVSWRPLSDP